MYKLGKKNDETTPLQQVKANKKPVVTKRVSQVSTQLTNNDVDASRSHLRPDNVHTFVNCKLF